MSNITKNNIFSLRLKLSLILSVIALAAAAGLIVLSVAQLEAQFKSSEKMKFDRLRGDFYYLIQRTATELTVFAEQIANLNDNAKDYETFKASVENSWEDFELIANVSSIQFYNVDSTNPAFTLGYKPSLDTLNLAQEAINTGAPVQRVHCKSECLLIVSTPILTKDGRASIVLEKSLLEILMALSQLNDVDVGMLSAYSSDTNRSKSYFQNWRLQSTIMTNETKLLPFLQSVSEAESLDDVTRHGVIATSDHLEYMIWAVPLTDLMNSSHYLLIITDVTDTRAMIKEHLYDSMAMALLAIFILSILSIVLSNIPIKKIRKLVEQYDLIAQQEFKQVIKNLPESDKRFPDEIDVLYDESRVLVHKLELLDADIKQKTSQLEHQAMHDQLTSLGNRNLFRYELQRTIDKTKRSQHYWALIFFDLDKFKLVNDTLGHDVGDELLKLVATRLTDCLRTLDVVCRLGGDEFTVIINELKRREDITIVMDKIFTVMGQPTVLGGKNITAGCSAGVIVGDETLTDPDEAIKAADVAMYESKRSGRNRYKIFDEEMSQEVKQNFMIESEFANAILRSQFVLYYQPQVDINNGKLIGLEALVRWDHPKHGMMLPLNFIPILDESNRILELGRWVAREAVDAVAQLSRVYKDIELSINISQKQINDDSFITLLSEECFDKQVNPNQLTLELTENILIEELDDANEWIKSVKRNGFNLAIDDFGTGYSSLNYLSKLPFDTVKLDQSFVAGLSQSKNERALVTSVIEMVKKMDSKVIAEGIEDAEQISMLTQLGCDFGQGYLIQRPSPFNDIYEQLVNYDKGTAWHSIQSIVNVEYLKKNRT
jgi:diguanylate cyclase